jgi:hypothetical protein
MKNEENNRRIAAFIRLIFVSLLAIISAATATAQVTFQNLHDFNFFTEGDGPQPLTIVSSTIYGTTGLDGPGKRGSVYSMNLNGSGFHLLASINGSGGSSPVG